MRILLLTETLPYPLDSGGRIKTYHTLRMLSSAHDVHCVAFTRHADQAAHLPHLRDACAAVTLELLPRHPLRELGYLARSLRTGLPYTIVRHVSRAGLATVKRVCSQGFDLVYADHLSMMEYARGLGLPIVHDAHNVEFEILRRYAKARRFSPLGPLLAREWRRVRAYERVAYRAADRVCAVSAEDAAAIRRLAGPSAQVVVVPISVDARTGRRARPLTREPRLLFVGGLHWPPNLDAVLYFAREIWPHIREARPDARLTIVGRDDVAAARGLRQTPGFTLAGYVDAVDRYFDESRLMVVPLRAGSGMRVKILDAFARGLPVVSTPTGHEGIAVEHDVHLLSAIEPRRFAQDVVRLLGDDALADRLAARSRQLVEEHYDVAVVRSRLLDAVRTVAGPAH